MLTPDSAVTRTARPALDFARIALILGGIGLITLVYREIPDERVLLNKVLQYLYFLPIVVAGLWFGWRGGVLAALTTSVLYLPGILAFGASRPNYTPDEYGEALDLFITGSVVGFLANRERRKTVELQRTNDRLEKTYRQLQESIEKLRQSERLSAVGQLAANLAHEIRNPLASIEGAADLLHGSGPEGGHEFVQIIKKESRRLSKLLTDLLDFARPRSPEYMFVPLSEPMHSVAELLQPMAQKAGITLREESAPDVQPVQCDPAQMKQLILNLMMNAIQTMHDGGEIVLRERREGNRAILEVADQGSGLTAEEIEQLFIPFYTTKKDGTGLGLPIAQAVVLAHAGEISVHENTPKGSVFRVSLPLVQPGVKAS
jgi:two-component system, NtrC family, sensor histidine kinase HydH